MLFVVFCVYLKKLSKAKMCVVLCCPCIEPTTPTTMSSLTLLTATVVVLGLWCWVPTGAYINNPRMVDCNRTAMSVVSPLNLVAIHGRWYESHTSTSGDAPSPYNAVAVDLYKSSPLPSDKTGHNAEFVVFNLTYTKPSATEYSKSLWLNEVSGDKWPCGYKTRYFDHPENGYFIYWYNNYVLATDYTSTFVMLDEYVFNGNTDIKSSEIKVFVRDPALPPDTAVVDKALRGFCQGDALDLSSDFYVQIPNDSGLPCFAPPAK